MLVIVFDTETTGLPKSKNVNDTDKWPHIVQFSYVIYNTDTQKIEKVVDEIIKLPENIIMEQVVINIHGITNEISQNKGINIKKVIADFMLDLQNVELLVGHNLSFDINVLTVEILRIINEKNIENKYSDVELNKKIEYWKSGLINIINEKKKLCTMQETIDLCNIKMISKKDNKEFVKFPKLSELHNYLFNYVPENLHNSLIDVYICLKCFCKLKYDITLDEKKFYMEL
jgi:DNA polymerase III epsilon subunit-like protein